MNQINKTNQITRQTGLVPDVQTGKIPVCSESFSQPANAACAHREAPFTWWLVVRFSLRTKCTSQKCGVDSTSQTVKLVGVEQSAIAGEALIRLWARTAIPTSGGRPHEIMSGLREGIQWIDGLMIQMSCPLLFQAVSRSACSPDWAAPRL